MISSGRRGVALLTGLAAGAVLVGALVLVVSAGPVGSRPVAAAAAS